MSDATMNEADILSRMDDSKITKQHWKIMFISGMGFFTDAYDLFIIGVVISILRDEWHPSPWAVGLVTSTALLAAAFGAIIFGRVADMLGRKRIYGYEVLVLAAGAIASAFSPDIWWLIGFRIILGVGIGGDYPVSATLMSEFSGKKSRDAGCRPYRRTASGSRFSGLRLVERPGVAPPAGIRRHTGTGRVPDAATYGGKPALSPGQRST